MANLGETADNYQKPKLHNVTELDFISANMEVLDENEAEFPYKYVMVDGIRYKIPKTVIEDIQQFRKISPNITKYKIASKGSGKEIKYTVIPLQ